MIRTKQELLISSYLFLLTKAAKKHFYSHIKIKFLDFLTLKSFNNLNKDNLNFCKFKLKCVQMFICLECSVIEVEF